MSHYVKYVRAGSLRAWRVFLAVLAAQPCLPQVALGSMSWGFPPAKRLEQPMAVTAGLKSLDSLGSVGNVAFGAVATGQNGLAIVDMQRDAARADGERLRATLADRAGHRQTVTGPLPDWLLLPIAQFARGDKEACLTNVW